MDEIALEEQKQEEAIILGLKTTSQNNSEVSRRLIQNRALDKVESNKPTSTRLESEGYIVISEEKQSEDGTEKESEGEKVRQAPEKQKASLSHRLKVASRVFDIMSASSHIDHPLCVVVSFNYPNLFISFFFSSSFS